MNPLTARRKAFEEHTRECSVCTAPVDNTPGGAVSVQCRAGQIMLAHYMRAIKEPTK